jgi:hypothetical protein
MHPVGPSGKKPRKVRLGIAWKRKITGPVKVPAQKEEPGKKEAQISGKIPEIGYEYTMENLNKEYAESMEEMARGECYTFYSPKESQEFLDEIKRKVQLEKENEEKLKAGKGTDVQ